MSAPYHPPSFDNFNKFKTEFFSLHSHQIDLQQETYEHIQKFVELHRTQPLFIVFHSFILILIIRHISAHFQAIFRYDFLQVYTEKTTDINGSVDILCTMLIVCLVY
jgi:hypothetical protein